MMLFGIAWTTCALVALAIGLDATRPLGRRGVGLEHYRGPHVVRLDRGARRA